MALQIWQTGIDLTLQRNGTDFGKGFYTTTQWDQARRWAHRRAGQEIRRGATPVPAAAIIAFQVDPQLWGKLTGQEFGVWPAPDAGWQPFVHNCRRMGLLHHFDYVYGPVYNPNPFAHWIFQGMDQLAVHTRPATAFLYHGRLGIWEERGVLGWTRVKP